MALEKHLSELQGMITKFLAIHANPYDTSKHNNTAAKLEKIQVALSQVNTTPVTPEELNEKIKDNKTINSMGEATKKFKLNLSPIPNSVTDADNHMIYIKSDQPIEKVVMDVAWEFTNASNDKKFDAIHAKAKEGKITEEEYVKSKGRIEAEAQYNAIAAAKEMKTSNADIKKFLGGTSAEWFDDVVNKKMTKEQFIEKIMQSHYDNGVINGRPAREVYGEQYQIFRYGEILPKIEIKPINAASDNLGNNSQWIKR